MTLDGDWLMVVAVLSFSMVLIIKVFYASVVGSPSVITDVTVALVRSAGLLF